MAEAIADLVNQARLYPFDKIADGIADPAYRPWAIEVVADVLRKLDRFERLLGAAGGDVKSVEGQLGQIRAALGQIDRTLKGELDDASRKQAAANYAVAREQLDQLYERARRLEEDCYR